MNFDADFLKDRYDYELQRREQLTTALTLPVGVFTVRAALLPDQGDHRC